MKLETKPVYTAPTKDILNGLLCESQWLKLLGGNRSKYEKLLSHIELLSKREKENEYEKFTIKSISIDINEKTSTITKWLNQIYLDIIDLNQTNPVLFIGPGNLYELYFKDHFFQNRMVFNMWLNIPLQVYDSFSWGFLIGRFQYCQFWIENIEHEHKYGKVKSLVTLTNSGTNRYRDFLYDRANFEGRLDFNELMNKHSYEVDKLLKNTYK